MENPELKQIMRDLEENLIIPVNHSCHICGSPLELFHKTNFSVFQVIESAHCNRCGITLKNTLHILH